MFNSEDLPLNRVETSPWLCSRRMHWLPFRIVPPCILVYPVGEQYMFGSERHRSIVEVDMERLLAYSVPLWSFYRSCFTCCLLLHVRRSVRRVPIIPSIFKSQNPLHHLVLARASAAPPRVRSVRSTWSWVERITCSFPFISTVGSSGSPPEDIQVSVRFIEG